MFYSGWVKIPEKNIFLNFVLDGSYESSCCTFTYQVDIPTWARCYLSLLYCKVCTNVSLKLFPQSACKYFYSCPLAFIHVERMLKSRWESTFCQCMEGWKAWWLWESVLRIMNWEIILSFSFWWELKEATGQRWMGSISQQNDALLCWLCSPLRQMHSDILYILVQWYKKTPNCNLPLKKRIFL